MSKNAGSSSGTERKKSTLEETKYQSQRVRSSCTPHQTAEIATKHVGRTTKP